MTLGFLFGVLIGLVWGLYSETKVCPHCGRKGRSRLTYAACPHCGRDRGRLLDV